MSGLGGSSEDCVICGQDQRHRPMCYRGLNVCSGACEDKLLEEVKAEILGDLEALEAERPSPTQVRVFRDPWDPS